MRSTHHLGPVRGRNRGPRREAASNCLGDQGDAIVRRVGIVLTIVLFAVLALPALSAASGLPTRMFINVNPAGPAAPDEPVELTATVVGPQPAAVSWSVAPAPSVQVALQAGSATTATFQASEPGTYILTAASGPLVRTIEVRVYGPPAAVVLTPTQDELLADGRASETIQAQVVDQRGAQVGSFVGSVTLTDTAGQICGARQAVVALNGGAGSANLCAATRPGTDAISAGDLATYPDAAPVPGVRYGTATVADVAAAPARLALTAVSGGMRYLVARGSYGVMAIIRPVTYVDAARAEPVTVAVAVYDGANEPLAAPRTVSVQLTGPGSLSPYAPVQTALLTYPSASTFVVYHEAGQPGTIGISATAAGLPAATYSVQALASGPAAHFRVLVSRGFDDRGMPLNLYDVMVVDAGGQPVPDAVGPIHVTDDSATQPALFGQGHAAIVYAPAAAVEDAAAYRPGPASFPMVGGSAAFAIESRPGGAAPATMTITDPALGLSLRTHYVWATGRPVAAVMVASDPATIQVTDANGNPVAMAGLPVLFTFGPGQVWALTDTGGVASLSAPGQGAYAVSASFDQQRAAIGALAP